MPYQIDQSIKIENTNKATFVCLSNGQTIIVSISAKEKQKLKLFFRKLSKPLIFKLFTFSFLCAKAIMVSKIDSVAIDCEYVNHERQIKSFILQILKIEKIKIPDIWFSRIGKKSPAHIKGYEAMKKKSKGISVMVTEVLKYYEKINKF